ncbi:hypothetical protein PICSAR214_04322 [Mycobacterium avium subsp. paratuberculosis]|nr:hypothetical protein PICSAR214_04322 [Mycobacterium avium subsp. paratuberculosis]
MADDDNPASRPVNHRSARRARADTHASPGSGPPAVAVAGRGDNPASASDARAAIPSRHSDTSPAAEATVGSGAPLSTPASAAVARIRHQQASASNPAPQQPDSPIADTAARPAAAAASNTWERLGAPGTATKPASPANTVAIAPSARAAPRSR